MGTRLSSERSGRTNGKFFVEKIDKLGRWTDDLKHSLEMDLTAMDAEIKQVSNYAKLVATLDEKVVPHRKKNYLEIERNRKRSAVLGAG